MRSAVIVLLIICLTVLVSCGSNPAAEVERAARNFLEAAREGDTAALERLSLRPFKEELRHGVPAYLAMARLPLEGNPVTMRGQGSAAITISWVEASGSVATGVILLQVTAEGWKVTGFERPRD